MPVQQSSFSEEPIKSPKAQRRVSLRYSPIGSETFTHLNAVVEGFFGTVGVRNISTTGISLIVDYDLEPDLVVNLQLRNLGKMFSCRVPLRIVYMVEKPSGEWILGGAFGRKLLDKEIKALLT